MDKVWEISFVNVQVSHLACKIRTTTDTFANLF